MRRIGTILPISNEGEFPDIRTNLRRRGVRWFERVVFGGGGVIFWFYEADVSKLPVDTGTQDTNAFPQFLPTDDEGGDEAGHNISVLDTFLEAHPGTDVECPAS